MCYMAFTHPLAGQLDFIPIYPIILLPQFNKKLTVIRLLELTSSAKVKASKKQIL